MTYLETEKKGKKRKKKEGRKTGGGRCMVLNFSNVFLTLFGMRRGGGGREREKKKKEREQIASIVRAFSSFPSVTSRFTPKERGKGGKGRVRKGRGREKGIQGTNTTEWPIVGFDAPVLHGARALAGGREGGKQKGKKKKEQKREHGIANSMSFSLFYSSLGGRAGEVKTEKERTGKKGEHVFNSIFYLHLLDLDKPWGGRLGKRKRTER